MKKALKFTAILLSVLLIAIFGMVAYLKYVLPDVSPAPDIKVEVTPERVERGRYLANHVMVCMDCHSQRDWATFSGPLVEGTNGMGGEVFDQKLGFPGRFVAKNITPHKLSNWTDGELYRAITAGVSKDGTAFFPVMPYLSYGVSDTEDIYAIIAYLRSLPHIANDPQASVPDFPMNLILNTMPKDAQPTKLPDPADKLAYGKYLTTAAACADCHTRQEKGKVVGEPFAGGFAFVYPDGSTVKSANITPHETGIGSWTEAAFVQRFKAYADSAYVPQRVAPGQFQTVMPWSMYAGMTEQDLAAIYTYLRSLAPANNDVTVFESAAR